MHDQIRGHMALQSAGLGLLMVLLAACSRAPNRPVTPDPSPQATAVEIGPQVGFKAPEIVGRDVITKEPVALSSLVGQVVVLNFWAVWCKPCEEEMPHLEEFQSENLGKVRVIAVGADVHESPEKMAEFVQRLNLTFTVLDDKGAGAERYRIIGLPTSFFIDPNGIIRFKFTGKMTLNQVQRWAAETEEKGRK